jgi:diguanylate cyclase (GGDEF)-like protein
MPEGGWVATYEDISQRRQAEAKIVLLAHYDGLTGLVNRAYFHQQLAPALARVDWQTRRLAVLCLDLDGFKDVNDTYGHPTGDQLLREIGNRLKANCRETDIVARLGGDEFAILHIFDDVPSSADVLATRLIDRLSEPFDLDGRNVQITASIGIAIAPNDGRTTEEVMRNADLALYRAKSEGKRCHRFFEQDMEAERRERRSLENDLRAALANGELRVHFQPLVDSRKVEITGFEALMRWSHPVRGQVSPALFIPVAEEIGVISALGDWVLREACRQAATWPGELTLAINLSPAQFKTGNLIETLQDVLAASRLAPHRLELEITESLLLDKCDTTMQTLHAMRALGIRIAMDDFGTGYSSLSYLRSFPFDKIKIDQSFVRELTSHPDCIKIVRSIAALGASLGMTTTAEGVETAEQFEQLQRAGCDQVQGYLFGRPRPIDELCYALPRNLDGQFQTA